MDKKPLVEVLVVRDPDYYTDVEVWVNGVRWAGEIVTVDPGAGHERSEWVAARDNVTGSPEFVAAAREAYDRYADSKYLLDDDEDEDDYEADGSR